MALRTPACATLSAVLLLSPALVTAATADDGGPSAREPADEATRTFLAAHSVHLRLTDNSGGARADGPMPAGSSSSRPAPDCPCPP